MVSIQSLAELVGHLVLNLPGTVFIKRLEILKLKSLAKKEEIMSLALDSQTKLGRHPMVD